MVSPCFQFERELNFPFDWAASVSNILTVRKWAEPKIVGRNFTSRIRPFLQRESKISFTIPSHQQVGGNAGALWRKRDEKGRS